MSRAKVFDSRTFMREVKSALTVMRNSIAQTIRQTDNYIRAFELPKVSDILSISNLELIPMSSPLPKIEEMDYSKTMHGIEIKPVGPKLSKAKARLQPVKSAPNPEKIPSFENEMAVVEDSKKKTEELDDFIAFLNHSGRSVSDVESLPSGVVKITLDQYFEKQEEPVLVQAGR